MKFHFAAIIFLGLAADMVSAKRSSKHGYSFEKPKLEQEQCAIEDASDFTQQDGSVLGCVQSVVTDNRRSSLKNSSSSKKDEVTDSTDGCGTLRILPSARMMISSL